MGWFKSIVFVGSRQDTYVPFDSARIEVGEGALDEKNGNKYCQMAENIISQIKASAIYKVDVAFELQESNFDTMIGRAAHIQFLEDQALMKLLFYRYWDLFN